MSANGEKQPDTWTAEMIVSAIRSATDDLANRIDTLRRDLEEDHADLIRRMDYFQATLNEHGRRISNMEQAIVKIVPALNVA